MSGYLVDTNVISEFKRSIPDAHVMLWLRSIDPDLISASVITSGELRLGIENLTPSKRRTDLGAWLQTGLPRWFASRLLPVTKAIAGQWAEVTATAKRNGLLLKTADGQIGATALEHNLTLVTRNVKDSTGLALRFSILGMRRYEAFARTKILHPMSQKRDMGHPQCGVM